MSLDTHPPNKEKGEDKDNQFKHTSRLLPVFQILSNPGMFNVNGRWTRVVAAVSLPLSLSDHVWWSPLPFKTF